MKYELKRYDTFIKKWYGDSDDYIILYITDADEKAKKYVGNMHIISDSGVVTRINTDISNYVYNVVPIPKSFYRKIMKIVDNAQFEAINLLLRVKHTIPKHLKEHSCFVFNSLNGLWYVNKVEFFEAISDDDTLGIQMVEVLDEEWGEVHSETFEIGNRTFNLGHSWIIRDEVDEEEDFIISKKAYNIIGKIHSKLIADFQALLNDNPICEDL